MAEPKKSYREVLETIGKRILDETRSELYVSMHFLGPALGSLPCIMDLSTTSIGTDAAYIRYNPKFLMTKYIEEPYWLDRMYLHILLHCLFRHMYAAKEHEDLNLWNLCCDISAESIIDSMDYPIIAQPVREKRSAYYQEMEEQVGVLSAQRLYHYFTSKERNYAREAAMQEEFIRDDHGFWERMEDEEDQDVPPVPAFSSDNIPLIRTKRLSEQEWKKLSDKVRVEASMGREAGKKTGTLVRYLQYEGTRRTDFRKYLEKFMIEREEAGVDLDSFDYGYYNYGLTLYGNMPLIEENEYRQVRKVEELIIVLDTSASCQEVLVQEFLNETAAMLLREDLFFRKVQIRILECDDRIQNDIEIKDRAQMREYARHFCLKGGFGTDFRPAFAYVEQLRKEKKIYPPRALLYFTDGKGIYPTKPTDYETAFVFVKEEDPDTQMVPDWAIRLFI